MLIYRKSVISNVISNCDMDVLDSHVYSPSGITMLKYNNAEKFVLFSELVEGCDLDGFACQDFKEKGETLLRSSSLSVLRILYYFNSLCKSQLIDYWLLNDLLLCAFRDLPYNPTKDFGDVGMFNEDYLKLLDVISHVLPKDLEFVKRTKGQGSTAYIKDKNSCNGRCISKNAQCEDGIHLNIYVFYQTDDFENSKIVEDSAKQYKFHVNDIAPVADVYLEGLVLNGPRNFEKVLSKKYAVEFSPYEEIEHNNNSKRDALLLVKCDRNGFISYPWYGCGDIRMLNDKQQKIIIQQTMTNVHTQ